MRDFSARDMGIKGSTYISSRLDCGQSTLNILTGYIGNTFIQAWTNEFMFTNYDSEFGDYVGSNTIVVWALYDLTTSAEIFCTNFTNFLFYLTFVHDYFDCDVWIWLPGNQDIYDYICTHVDGFKVITKYLKTWIDQIAGICIVKEMSPWSYYLGNAYTCHDGKYIWTYICLTHSKKATNRGKWLYGCLPKKFTPLSVMDYHPELDDSPLLPLNSHQKFQILMCVLQGLTQLIDQICVLVYLVSIVLIFIPSNIIWTLWGNVFKILKPPKISNYYWLLSSSI